MLPRLIPEIASQTGAHLINLYNEFGGDEYETKKELYCDDVTCDGCHPTEAGFKAIASTIFQNINK